MKKHVLKSSIKKLIDEIDGYSLDELDKHLKNIFDFAIMVNVSKTVIVEKAIELQKEFNQYNISISMCDYLDDESKKRF